MLSLFTDFVIVGAGTGTVNKIRVVLNDRIVYDEAKKYNTETVGFFLTRPNVLPVLTLPLLSFKLTILVAVAGAPQKTPKLLYNEIKVKSDMNLAMNMLKNWYLDDNVSKLFFKTYDDDHQLVDDTWDFLARQIPELKEFATGSDVC